MRLITKARNRVPLAERTLDAKRDLRLDCQTDSFGEFGGRRLKRGSYPNLPFGLSDDHEAPSLA